MNGYENGKIYRLTCNGLVYYGSTKQTLNQRFKVHTAPTNRCSSKKLFELGDVEIELVENYPCNSKRELEEREKHYITNFECINKTVPTRTTEEYKLANKDKIKKRQYIYNKKYREGNEELVKIKKEFYDENRDKILEQKKKYYEENKELIKERRKKYYESNKEMIKQKANERYNRIKTIT
jgi:hypothetical protein